MAGLINWFDGEHEFLSNFYATKKPLEYEDRYGTVRTAPTVEHHFQAHKATNLPDYAFVLSRKLPGQAKSAGRNIVIRRDWEKVKDQIMLDLLRIKFQQPDMKEALLATGNKELIEGTTWHDVYWGICVCVQHNNKGLNMLGILLEQVRTELMKE